ncbi:MAG: esterase family protein [Candidatus Kapaibacterium sp.]
MKQEQFSIDSKHLGRKMNITVLGHYGFTMLTFPSFGDDNREVIDNGMIASIAPAIERGKVRLYCVDSVNFESWLAEDKEPIERSRRHYEYNNFIEEEMLPFIFDNCGSPVPIMTCGAAIGAYHAANLFFRRPDIFLGCIAMSGTYNLEHFTQEYWDENCYFNSPVHYLPNLTDVFWMTYLRARHHIYLLSGSGENEYPDNARHLSHILTEKDVPHDLDIWGPEFGHIPESWTRMLPHVIDRKL